MKRLVNFNKQLVCGEIGALAGSPLFSLVASRLTNDPALISFSAVVGGLVGGSVFWLVVKFRDERHDGGRAARRLAGQIAWFSPAAFVLGLATYQPTLFLVGRLLIKRGTAVVPAVLGAQALAFGLFVFAMNLYRMILAAAAGKRI